MGKHLGWPWDITARKLVQYEIGLSQSISSPIYAGRIVTQGTSKVFRDLVRDPEWRNYWATRQGIWEWSFALWQVGASAAGRLFVKAVGKQVRPSYLSETELKQACQRKNPPAEFPKFSSRQTTNYRLPLSLVKWAQEYKRLFDLFLCGKYQASKDPEEYWTLHQFSWLLALILNEDPVGKYDQVQHYLEGWLNRSGNEKTDPSWRSFSISERLCNWVHLFELGGPEDLWPRVAESMEIQARHLASNLESFCGEETNNHLLNNGRALYNTGSLLDHQELKNLGRMILLNEARRQITPDGFLDEGSGHYQLIFSRAYLEALHTACLFGDKELQESLSPVVTQMLRASAFFADDESPEDWQIAFIGDISPDPPPPFFSRKMKFWQWAYKVVNKDIKDNVLTDELLITPWFDIRDDECSKMYPPLKGWVSFPESGYHRWNGEKYTVWWHCRNGGLPRRHSHNDWGSFQIHHQGDPLLIDPGRESYCEDQIGRSDKRMTKSQNTVQIDGFEQAIFKYRDLYVPEYLNALGSVEVSEDNGKGKLSICFSGYERLKDPITHSRTFHLNSEEIIIEDSFEGQGRHSATFCFHLHPGVICHRETEMTFGFKTPNNRNARFSFSSELDVKVKRGGDIGSPGGYCSNIYDNVQETTSIFFSFSFDTPKRIKHIITFL